MTTTPPIAARTYQLRRLLVHSAAGTTAARVLGAAGGVTAARLLTPASRGDLALLVVIASMGSLIGAAGIQFWIAREVARTHSLEVPTHVAVRHSRAIVVVFAGLGLLLAPVLVPHVVGGFDYVATVVYAMTGAVAFAALALPNGDRAMGTVAAALTIGSALYLGGTLALLVLAHPSVAAVLGFATLGNVGTVLIVMRFVRGRTSTRMTIGPRPIGAIWRGGVRYGLPGGIGELVSLGMLRIDFLLVGAFLPLSAVAIYAVATALTELLWVIPDATAQVVLPTAADVDTAVGSAPVFRVSMLATIVGAGTLCVLARPILQIVFGPTYARGAAIVPYLALAAIAGGAWKILAADVAARSGTRPRLVSAVVGLVVMVATDLLLIPSAGLRGAAIAAALGYSAALASVVWSWHLETRSSVIDLIGVRVADFELLRRSSAPARAIRVDA